MNTYGFSVVVDHLNMEHGDQLDRIYTENFLIAAVRRDKVTTIAVEIQATTSTAAVQIFLEHLRNTAPEIVVVRVEEDLVTVKEIAFRIDRDPETVRLWTRRPDFPAHHAVLHGGKAIWTWASIHEWITAYKPAEFDPDDVLPLSACVAVRANAALILGTQPGADTKNLKLTVVRAERPAVSWPWDELRHGPCIKVVGQYVVRASPVESKEVDMHHNLLFDHGAWLHDDFDALTSHA